MKTILTSFSLLFLTSFSFGTFSSLTLDGDTTYNDTVFDFFERSADKVYHVANNPSAPLYERYNFGSNLNFTEVAQKFDYPPAISGKYPVVRVQLMGFRVRVAVNLVQGGVRDSITFHYYDADADGFPAGAPLASGSFLSGGLQNTTQDYFIDADGTPITNQNGYLIAFETYTDDSDNTEDDIFVMANNYCIVAPPGQNDGRGEKRFKIKKISDGQWDNLIDFPTKGSLDCDAYVFPFLRITEGEPTGIEGAAFEWVSNIYPNPSSDFINIDVNNKERRNISLRIVDVNGREVISENLGKSDRILQKVSIQELPFGNYYVTISDGISAVTQNIIAGE